MRAWASIVAAASASTLAACAASAPQPAAHPPAQPQPAPAPATLAPATPAVLGSGATFADLVEAASARLRAGDMDRHADCLLSAGAGGYTLSAELMPALREPAESLTDLDAALARSRAPIRVLTAWGQLGAIDPGFALAAFTAVSPRALRAPAVALIATDLGVYLRYSDAAASESDGPLAVSAVVPRLLAQPHAAQAFLYVTAEAATPLARVAELLRNLPQHRSIALAQALPPGTRLPALGEPAPPAQTCPDGLPEPPAGSAEGELDPSAIVAALGPLREGARACLADATSAARAGGRLELALRIGPDGSVQHACLLQDGIGDAALAACVLQSARNLRMPPPSPSGLVDVQLPLSLTPETPPELRPLCEP